MPDVFDFVLTENPLSTAPVDVFEADRRARDTGFATPVDAAVAGGFGSDRLGYAFLAGYQAALRALLPDIPNVRTALCGTEAGGGHPAAIHTTLTPGRDGFTLDGTKSFVTLGSAAELLVVLAGDERAPSGRKALRAALVPAGLPGVSFTAQPVLPFTPEIPHATLRLTAVPLPAHAVLPGDGYLRYLKPFRTIEDLHIQAAVLGWLIGVARRSSWPAPWLEQALSLLAGVRESTRADPSAPSTHLAVAGLQTGQQRLLGDAEHFWDRTEPDTRERWRRDRPLLDVAGTVRTARTAAAWRRLTTDHSPENRTPAEPDRVRPTGETAR
ncbi:acyl-CoA dehydrogenase family protein [Skermania piniformis]|uniref:Acyl-CoA dehydrogenase family protein n=1 Tax=Skermania pinensis TaxID=39122 RepID=A0ABX8SAB2_9ACTN|nr:acyl-CoA dehydrogenase family protein [Skermania piniformis]QXQ14798.1 acyl-CoA dehydrogenase family protein [Skermania piniformis]